MSFRNYSSIKDLFSREFRNSKGTKFFANDPPPDNIIEEEVVTHVIGKKALLGKVWKDTESGDYVRYRCYSYGIEYKIGDPVFIESQRPEHPFHICQIQVSMGPSISYVSIFSAIFDPLPPREQP